MNGSSLQYDDRLYHVTISTSSDLTAEEFQQGMHCIQSFCGSHPNRMQQRRSRNIRTTAGIKTAG
jgi:hypothetical protein